MNKNFDPSNPQHLIYKHPPMDIAVLGGIRLEGLDRMRVTLKVQVEHLSIRHTFDLYNDTQTEKLIRKVAERLEVGTSVAAAALSSLTDILEAWRLEEIEQQQAKMEIKRKILNEKELKRTTVYLSGPNLDAPYDGGSGEVRNHWRRTKQAADVRDLPDPADESTTPYYQFRQFRSW